MGDQAKQSKIRDEESARGSTDCCVLCACALPTADRRKTLIGEVALMTAPTSTLHQKETRLLSGAIVLGQKQDALITHLMP